MGLRAQLALTFNLRDSRLGAQKLRGGVIDLRGQHLRKIDVDLDAAGNRLNAGAFGRPGDLLRLRLQAPRLETIGLVGLAGDARADIVVGKDGRKPEFSENCSQNNCGWPSRSCRAGCHSTGNWRARKAVCVGSCAVRRARCRCRVFRHSPLIWTSRVRSQHQQPGLPWLRNKIGAANCVSRLTAASRHKARTVRGRFVDQLERRAERTDPRQPGGGKRRTLLRLTAAAPLSLGRSNIAFGPATFDGLVGDLRIEQLALDKGEWQTAGRWQRFARRRSWPSSVAAFRAHRAQRSKPAAFGTQRRMGVCARRQADDAARWSNGRHARKW